MRKTLKGEFRGPEVLAVEVARCRYCGKSLFAIAEPPSVVINRIREARENPPRCFCHAPSEDG